jgi:hypothetical protein
VKNRANSSTNAVSVPTVAAGAVDGAARSDPQQGGSDHGAEDAHARGVERVECRGPVDGGQPPGQSTPEPVGEPSLCAKPADCLGAAHGLLQVNVQHANGDAGVAFSGADPAPQDVGQRHQ